MRGPSLFRVWTWSLVISLSLRVRTFSLSIFLSFTLPLFLVSSILLHLSLSLSLFFFSYSCLRSLFPTSSLLPCPLSPPHHFVISILTCSLTCSLTLCVRVRLCYSSLSLLLSLPSPSFLFYALNCVYTRARSSMRKSLTMSDMAPTETLPTSSPGTAPPALPLDREIPDYALGRRNAIDEGASSSGHGEDE